MSERIPNGVAKLVVFRAYLASDHVTTATGKTIAITISKNGGAFGNLAAGATNATEISSGFYKFTLATGDIDTNGPIAWRGAVATVDDAGDCYEVVNAFNAGFTGVAPVIAGAANGLLIAGTNAATTVNITGNITGNLSGSVGSLTTNNDKTGYTLGATGSAALTEGYAADGAAVTMNQAIYMILAFLFEKNVSGTTLTAKKLDGSTSAMTFTLDSATAPTTITRAS